MKFTDYLFEEVKDIWQEYLDHPFIKEMGEGTLSKDKFKNYLVQDYLYLKEFGKVFAMCLIKSKTIEEMNFFSRAISASIEYETAVHVSYMNKLGVPPKIAEKCKYEMTTDSYTSYMQSIALKGSLREIVMSTIPCNWSYNYIGHYLLDNYKDKLEGNYYREWIEMYSEGQFDDNLKEWLDYVNYLCRDISDEERENLKEIFIKSSLYELDFWHMAYKEVEVESLCQA